MLMIGQPMKIVFSVGYVPIEELRKQMNTGSRKFGPLCIEGEF